MAKAVAQSLHMPPDPASAANDPWEFSPALDLLRSLTERDRIAQQNQPTAYYEPYPGPKDVESPGGSAGGVALGDFERIWKHLGVDTVNATTAIPTFEASIATGQRDADAYASDGALYYPASSKTVKWRDETDGGELTEVQECTTEARLSKSQRKNRNRKLRKAAQKLQGNGTASDNNSADESDLNADNDPMSSLASKSLPQTSFLSSPSGPKSDGRADVVRGTAVTHKSLLPHNVAPPRTTMAVEPVAQPATPSFLRLYNPNTQVGSSLQSPPSAARRATASDSEGLSQQAIKEARDRVAAVMKGQPVTPQRSTAPGNTVHDSLKKWPVAQPVFHRQRSEPAERALGSSSLHQKSGVTPLEFNFAGTPEVKPTPTGARSIVPLTERSAAQRNWDLLVKLMKVFPENMDTLTSPLQLSANHSIPHGIHVFVDASNILIGFMNHLKESRGIPKDTRIPRILPSFHALALLLERRRPVAKRVLAGSTPWVPAFDQAKEIGYDLSILDKVYKARELTKRQRYFATRGANSGSNRSASDSEGPETESGPTHAAAKWVEQGVDEILHLKIAESILDTPAQKRALDNAKAEGQPTSLPGAPTMVVATGDAAEAEYSGGFRTMVVRALDHGWHVEVMAWAASINADWRSLEKSRRYADRFRIIELDDFAEYLFGPE